MAELIDEVIEDSTKEATPIDDTVTKETTLEDVVEPVAEKVEAKEEAKPEDDLPEKYKGKSVKEIVEMHQQAEKLIGKQGSEVGDLRKVVDDFIKTQTSKDSAKQETEVTEEDFYADPKSSVNKVIDSHPAIKEAKEAKVAMKRNETLTRLNSEHPDIPEIVQNPDFVEWIKASKVRTELFTRAEVDYDYDSAHELLSTWKEKQNISKKVAETSKVDREQQLKAADVGGKGNNEPVSKKKYRRSDIIKLMQNDPDRYDAMSEEIMAAYREGRVI